MLLYPLLFLAGSQTTLALLLSFPWGPLRSLGLFFVGAFKSQAGKYMTYTLSAILLVVLGFTFVNIRQILLRLRRSVDLGGYSAYEDKHDVLEESLNAALVSFCLVLVLLLDRLHSLITLCDKNARNIQVLKKQAKGLETEYLRLQGEKSSGEKSRSADSKRSGEGEEESENGVVRELREMMEEMRREKEGLEKQLSKLSQEKASVEASVSALKKQSEGLAGEYDRLLEDNQDLRDQLATFDKSFSKSDLKKKL